VGEVSLKEYIDRRFDDQEKAVQAALLAADKGVSAALASAEKAVDKAEEGSLRWREASNEWRGSMADRERDFLGRKEFYSIIGTLIALITFGMLFLKVQ
jgi:hypothetical protein